LVAGALVSLSQAGVLGRLPTSWVLVATGVAVVLGILVALLSRKPAPADPERPDPS
jgi:hypothetical protein